MLKVNIIGAGNVGKTIGKLIAKNKRFEINDILNSNFSSSQEACSFIGQGKPLKQIEDIKPADITFITTQDKYIKSILSELISNNKIKDDSIVVTCSGIISSDELRPILTENYRIVSIHPIKSFADYELSSKSFKGTYCAYEGDNNSFETIKSMFESFGGIVFKINSKNKALYHAACTIASNYTVTLTEIAKRCFEDSGVETETALDIANKLVLGAADNIQKLKSTNLALTGPIKREELPTIKKHLLSLKSLKTKAVYKSLMNSTLCPNENSKSFKDDIIKLISK